MTFSRRSTHWDSSTSHTFGRFLFREQAMDLAKEDKHCSHLSDSSAASSEAEEDFKGLRRVRDDVPWRLWAVAFISFWERATFWGITAPWREYTPQTREHFY